MPASRNVSWAPQVQWRPATKCVIVGRLLLDTGTFRLKEQERVAMGRKVDSVAAPDVSLLLLVWPRRRRPLIRGVERSEIEGAFPGWTVSDVDLALSGTEAD